MEIYPQHGDTVLISILLYISYNNIFILDFSYLVCYGGDIEMERRYLREIICVTERGERRQYKLTPF